MWTYMFVVCVTGVFGDKVTSVSVMEGDFVTLHTDITNIQRDDHIVWMFGPQGILIAEFYKESIKMYGCNEISKDRLKLDSQTGFLTIANIRVTDSGLYELKIFSDRGNSDKRFNVTVYGVFGVDGDEVKSVSVMEGDSVTLNTDITELQTRDQIVWMFGPRETRIAEIYKKSIDMYDSVEIFRNRLKLDSQTGSLIITNIRTTNAGLYKLLIISNRGTSYKRFYVDVKGVFGVDGDEVKSVSVMEGDSVTLHTDIIEIQSRDHILWMFGPQETRLAEIYQERIHMDDSCVGMYYITHKAFGCMT
nr:uncharacterized protein LOC129452935 [Misgurnus anguillicaudatus]